MKYPLYKGFVYRKRDKIPIMAFLILGNVALFSEIIRLRLIFLMLFTVMIFYRFILLRHLKKLVIFSVDDEKVTVEGYFIKKKIYFEEIKVLAFSEKIGKTGDLILNLNGLSILNEYWNNLISDVHGFSDIRGINSILIPDVLEVGKVYREIAVKIRDKGYQTEKIKCRGYEVVVYDGQFEVLGKRSQIIYFDKKRISEKNGIIKIKTYDISLNNNAIRYSGLPPLKLVISERKEISC